MLGAIPHCRFVRKVSVGLSEGGFMSLLTCTSPARRTAWQVMEMEIDSIWQLKNSHKKCRYAQCELELIQFSQALVVNTLFNGNSLVMEITKPWFD